MIFRKPLKIEQGKKILHLMVLRRIRGYLFIKCIEYRAKLTINGQYMSLLPREGYCDLSSINCNFQILDKTRG